MTSLKTMNIDSYDAYINRELSWLSFARRVLELAECPTIPLLERVKFAGIMGMIYDEFAMKRMGSLHIQIKKKPEKVGPDGLTPREELLLCRKELENQMLRVSRLIDDDLRPALFEEGIPLYSYSQLSDSEKKVMNTIFVETILPILTPLAVDIGHPFPFISNLGLNLAILVTEHPKEKPRFVRLKVPTNRERWLPLPGTKAFIPLEEVIAANLDALFPTSHSIDTFCFRVTRAGKDNPWDRKRYNIDAATYEPGSIVDMVTKELSYRKVAGIVRLEVSEDMPQDMQSWLAERLEVDPHLTMPSPGLLGFGDLLDLKVDARDDLRDAPHKPVHHPRLSRKTSGDSETFFREIKKGDILIHLPYHNFDSSVLKLFQHAAKDPKVLAIKLTIYRTGSKSEIIQALMEAAEHGKQVAVLVEIMARFDEVPNIAWGKKLEKAGAHVVYGMERLKTHVKLAMVVREEEHGIQRYVHVGTGNYHPETARLYGDLGIFSSSKELGDNVSTLFNELTGAIPSQGYNMLLVAPHNMRKRFTDLIDNEIRYHKEGKPSGIRAKFNQLQDRSIIRHLYQAGQAGVPITLNIRGLCCLRAGVPGFSENIQVFSTLGRFLEHSRIYRFENGGKPLFFIGSADWMKRNLDKRMETIVPVKDPAIQSELENILNIYELDNANAWDMQADGSYKRREPQTGEAPLIAQEIFANRDKT